MVFSPLRLWKSDYSHGGEQCQATGNISLLVRQYSVAKYRTAALDGERMGLGRAGSLGFAAHQFPFNKEGTS